MGKRKAAGEVGAETSTHPQAGAGAGSADSPGSALRNLKLKRLNEFMNELEDAYRAAVTKAMAGKNREQRAVITKVLDDMRQQLFDLLRQNSVDDDDVEMEELNRELARRVEKLEKEANKLGLAVKEKRDKMRKTLPTAIRSKYAEKLEDFQVPTAGSSSSASSSSSAAAAGAGAASSSSSAATSAGSAEDNEPAATAPAGKRKRHGRKSGAGGAGAGTSSSVVPLPTLVEAGTKDKISAVADQLRHATGEMKRIAPSIESTVKAVHDTLEVIQQAQSAAGATGAAIDAALKQAGGTGKAAGQQKQTAERK